VVFQDINFLGNVYPTLVALPYLHQSHGRVIINASVESWLPLPRMSLFGVSDINSLICLWMILLVSSN
jgi:short-subunit dehydrogenase